MSDDTPRSAATDGTDDYPFPQPSSDGPGYRRTGKTRAYRSLVVGRSRYVEGVDSPDRDDAVQWALVGDRDPIADALRGQKVGRNNLDGVVMTDTSTGSQAAARELLWSYPATSGVSAPPGFDPEEGPLSAPDPGAESYRPYVARAAEEAADASPGTFRVTSAGEERPPGSTVDLTNLLDEDHPDRMAVASRVGDLTTLYTGSAAYDEAAEADVVRGLVDEYADVEATDLVDDLDPDELAASVGPDAVGAAMDDEALAAHVDREALFGTESVESLLTEDESYDPERDPESYDDDELAALAAAADVDLTDHADGEDVLGAATPAAVVDAAGTEEALAHVDADVLVERYPDAVREVDVLDYPNVADGSPSRLVEATDPDLVVAAGGEDWSLTDEQAAAMDEAGVTYAAARDGEHARTLGESHVHADTGGVGMMELYALGTEPSADSLTAVTVGDLRLHEPDPATRGRFDVDTPMVEAGTATPKPDPRPDPEPDGAEAEPTGLDRLTSAVGSLFGRGRDDPEEGAESASEPEVDHYVPTDGLTRQLVSDGAVGGGVRLVVDDEAWGDDRLGPEEVADVLADPDRELPTGVGESDAEELIERAKERGLAESFDDRLPGGESGEPPERLENER